MKQFWLVLILFLIMSGIQLRIDTVNAEIITWGGTEVRVVKIEMQGISDDGVSVSRPLAQVESILEKFHENLPIENIKHVSHVIQGNYWIYTIWYTKETNNE